MNGYRTYATFLDALAQFLFLKNTQTMTSHVLQGVGKYSKNKKVQEDVRFERWCFYRIRDNLDHMSGHPKPGIKFIFLFSKCS